MNLQQGPLFGAMIVGTGIGYLLYQKTQNIVLAVLAAAAITMAGYGLEVWLKSVMGNPKK